MKNSRQTIVDVLREVAECMERHRIGSFREHFRRHLPPEALAIVEAEIFKGHQQTLEAQAAVLRRFESGEIDLDEYCRQTLALAAEQGARCGPGIFEAFAKIESQVRR